MLVLARASRRIGPLSESERRNVKRTLLTVALIALSVLSACGPPRDNGIFELLH